MFNGAPTSIFTGVPGWESINEQQLLIHYAKQVPWDNAMIVEIGAEFGMSASLFCMAAPIDAQIISIDLFPDDLLEKHRDNLQRVGYADRSRQIIGDSSTIGKMWGTPIDLLFIDGDHSYQGVKKDITAWMEHVKVGGVVLFHDCACPTNQDPHPLHHEVTRAIDEWAQKNPLWLEGQSVDSIRIFRRNG